MAADPEGQRLSVDAFMNLRAAKKSRAVFVLFCTTSVSCYYLITAFSRCWVSLGLSLRRHTLGVLTSEDAFAVLIFVSAWGAKQD
jgi:hypothetical protein